LHPPKCGKIELMVIEKKESTVKKNWSSRAKKTT
jgi:hypothetical protein